MHSTLIVHHLNVGWAPLRAYLADYGFHASFRRNTLYDNMIDRFLAKTDSSEPFRLSLPKRPAGSQFWGDLIRIP